MLKKPVAPKKQVVTKGKNTSKEELLNRVLHKKSIGSRNHKKKKVSSKRRRINKKHTKSRRISFRCYPQKNKNIDTVIEKADKMSNEEIKKELIKEGIEVKSNKKQLLKDIYMFSSMGGITINRE